MTVGRMKVIEARISCDSPRRTRRTPFLNFRSAKLCDRTPWIVAFMARKGDDAFWCARCGATARGKFMRAVVPFKHAHLGC